jgi:hypothetical protein
MAHYLNGVFARTSKNEPAMQENHIPRNLKSVLYCIFRDVSPDISMAVKRVKYIQKVVTQRKVSGGRYHCHCKEPKTWSVAYQNNNPQILTNIYWQQLPINTEFFAPYSNELQGT